MRRLRALVCSQLVVVGFVGCGEPRPEGMPELFPAKFVLTQEGVPLADASVTFIPENASLARWPVGAVSNANGEAELKTFAKFSGAPAGKFKVIVNKSVTEGAAVPEHPGGSATPEQMREYDKAMKSGGFQVYDVVESKYRSQKTSPLEVEVVATGPNDFPLEAGAAVKEKNAKASNQAKNAVSMPTSQP